MTTPIDNGGPALSGDPLLEPFQLKGLVLRNRVMSTSHAAGLDDDGQPGERYQRYHEEKARGGLALTMFGGSANVAPDSPSVFRQLDVSHDAVIPYFEAFAERIHRHGAALMCQLTHLGRRGDPYTGHWLPTIAPSRLRETLHRSFPKVMDTHDIDRVIRAFAAGARRCQVGGLDGVETLAGGHLIGQFLSPATNRRDDVFGGSTANRCRFALMVHRAIRRAVGDAYPVGIRLAIDEDWPDGITFEEGVEIARILEDEGDIDFFNCVVGRMDSELALAEANMPGMASPIAPHLETVGAFKRAVRLPVFHAARITDPATARHALKEGHLDMVGMTRAHLADPELVAKIIAGEPERIRPCIGAGYCLTRKPHCIHNAATGRETTLEHTIAPSGQAERRVVVVGAGPAGLESARVAAERGHRVTVFEATTEPGGQVAIAARADGRRDLGVIIDWRITELERLGVDVRYGCLAEAETVSEERPDAVIVATGGVPDMHWLDGAEHCVSVWDVLTGMSRPAGNVLVYDGTGQHAAASCAVHLAGRGCEVTFVTRDDRLVQELGYTERAIMRKLFHEHGIPVITEHVLTRVDAASGTLEVTLTDELTGRARNEAAAHVVVEHGTVPVDDVYADLRAASVNDGVTDLDRLLAGRPQRDEPPQDGFELHRIGDALASRNIHAAIHDAYRLCTRL